MSTRTASAHPLAGAPGPAHSVFDDAQGILTGALFVAFGMLLLKQAGLLTGGTAGIAFLTHYATGWDFGTVFFLVNLPFYGFAAAAMGRAFLFKTFAAVAAASAASTLLPQFVAVGHVAPWFAAIMGGFLVGAGLLMLFRHKASLGGVNVLALYLQERRAWRAGTVQMAVDCAIVLAAFTLVDVTRVALSILGAITLNFVVAVNHRPGRYLAV